jgi:hypothetical protein
MDVKYVFANKIVCLQSDSDMETLDQYANTKQIVEK